MLISPPTQITAHLLQSEISGMSSLLTIDLPVRKHLHKYYLREFKTRFTLDDPLGITLNYMLRMRDGEKYDEDTLSKYPAKLTLEVPEHLLMEKRISPYLSRQCIHHLDRILDADFKRSMFRHIAREVGNGVDRQVAIESFCAIYDILENDISFEALKKADYRYRSSKQAA